MLRRSVFAIIAFSFVALPTNLPEAKAQLPTSFGEYPQLDAANDWPWWRGPRRDGHTPAGTKLPTRFSETEPIVWKSAVPGRGHASPTIVGSQIFLATADEQAETQSVVAFDKATGKQLWQTELSRGGFPKIHRNNTHASATIACDGELLFAVFHHHNQLQAVALKRDGAIAWQRSLGDFHPKRYEYGYGPSPVLYHNLVLIGAEYDGESHVSALDRKTGNAVWRVARQPHVSYSTPSIQTIGGRDLMTMTGDDKLICYDPATGKELWNVQGCSAATCGTVVWDGDLLFASGGYPKADTICVRVGPNGGEVLWRNNQKCYEQSMLAHDGHLYALTDNGIAFCFRGSDGKEMWRERLQGPVSASPVLADGLIYWANERGTHYVFRASPEKYDLVAENKLGDESFASPAVSGNRMYLRVAHGNGAERREMLYCFGR